MTEHGIEAAVTARERLRQAATLRLPDARLPRLEVDALLVEYEREAAASEPLRAALENLADTVTALENRAIRSRASVTMRSSAHTWNSPRDETAPATGLTVEALAEAVVAHTLARGSFHDDGPGCMRECATDILARLSPTAGGPDE